MADRIVGEDDVVLSIIKYIKDGRTVVVKDSTGISGMLSGTFSSVFPEITVEPSHIRDMEKAVYPRIIVDKMSRIPGEATFGSHGFAWSVSLEINAVWVDSVTGIVDNDISVIYMYQIDTALRQLFEPYAYVPLYSYTYDGAAPQLLSEMTISGWGAIQDREELVIYGAMMVFGPCIAN